MGKLEDSMDLDTYCWVQTLEVAKMMVQSAAVAGNLASLTCNLVDP